MDRTVAILGSMDTKGEEYVFIKKHIDKTGLKTLLIDIGVMGEPAVVPDFTNVQVAKAAGKDLEELKNDNPTREKIAPIMAEGAKNIVLELIYLGNTFYQLIHIKFVVLIFIQNVSQRFHQLTFFLF